MAKRKHYRKIYSIFGKKRGGGAFWKLGLFFVLFLFFGFSFLFVYYAKDLPRPEKFAERRIIQSSRIYDRTGNILLYEIYGPESRDYVSLELMPDYLKKAVLIAEDRNFYDHFGIDFQAISRSILLNIRAGQLVFGGSTIPQQLIRNTFLTRERTLGRKIREIVLALEIDRRYSKEQILEWYLNQIPMGGNAYGVEAASQKYFGKSVSEISLEEAATLAALIQAPSYLSPHGPNKERLLARKNNILDGMVQENKITKEEREKAKNKEITFRRIGQPIRSPHFVMKIKNYLFQKYDEETLKKGGLKIYTTLDWQLQQLAETAVQKGVERNKMFLAHNAALVSINPKNGQVLALVGSADWFGSPYPLNCQPGKNCLFEPYPNVAIRERQPGSAFKPFVYAAAFKKGYTDTDVVIDEETNFGTLANPYIPRNFDGLFRGEVTLRQALAQSLNIPSIKVLRDFAGLKESIELSKEMGITTLTKPPLFYGLPLVLGGGETKLLEMVSTYGVFATEGLKVKPVFILKIEDQKGNIIEESKRAPKRVLEREVCRLINDILSDDEARSPVFGRRSLMYFENYQVAVKTGTTDNFRDGWIIGYTPWNVTGVWVGNNDNSPMRREPGTVLAGPIWRTFMTEILKKYPVESFNKPR
ncbi:MAG: PBP1A family penicillin-binding protein [Candidatus Nealsonbacteria bacterium]|nr:PBP1A family penicillin-binding protein [Candidatus Nealsonbacteria bacterium]